MSLAHHPSEELLLDFAAGRLEHGPALVLKAHLGACPDCRGETARLEAVGGVLMAALPAAPMADDALARALARIEAPERPDLRAPIEVGLPELLAGERLGPRRWLAPGLWLRRLEPEGRSRFNTYLLHTSPGRRLPRHGHQGAEYVCVLEGAFSDATGRYGAGDFACGDEELVHEPLAEAGEACLCLISTQGRLRMHSLIGRVLQPVAGV
jgi:putative transcriptional regulator